MSKMGSFLIGSFVYIFVTGIVIGGTGTTVADVGVGLGVMLGAGAGTGDGETVGFVCVVLF